jgi:Ser/Thr protein kinase RdoA (MazF antagonist)
MRIAAEAGVAPPLHYVDDQAGVAIMELIPTKPLTAYPGGPVELVPALGRLTVSLQATGPFPALMDYRTVVRRLTERLQTRFAPGLLDPHREALERICETLPWDSATHVSSHNDPNPRNILFDGERLWLVDWETAYRNDPFVDLAILSDNLAPTPELAEALLKAWLNREAEAEHRQRLKVLRSLTRLYYAGLLATLIAPATPVVSDLAAPSREEFTRGIADGSLKFAAAETRVTLVKMSLAGFLESL